MKILEKYRRGKTVISFEVFPPKKNSKNPESIIKTVEKILPFDPDFISVTYGAGGSVPGNDTMEFASIIKNKYGIDSMAHLTCVSCTKQDIDIITNRLKENNVENIMALRGDVNSDAERKKDFFYASELVNYIKGKGNEFCIAGACYPETHSEAASMIDDIRNLKTKVDAGTDFLITQLFLDNNVFYTFREKAAIAGVNIPISAGIMPVTNAAQINRMVTMCGATLPNKFVKMLQKYDGKPESLIGAGIAYAVDQIIDLIASDVDGVHIYTMNNPYIAEKIMGSINNLL